MNKYNVHLYLPLLEALRDGELQMEVRGIWLPAPEVDFDSPPDRYRRKPKPREFYAILYPDGVINGHANEDKTKEWGNPNCVRIRVREIIE